MLHLDRPDVATNVDWSATAFLARLATLRVGVIAAGRLSAADDRHHRPARDYYPLSRPPLVRIGPVILDRTAQVHCGRRNERTAERLRLAKHLLERANHKRPVRELRLSGAEVLDPLRRSDAWDEVTTPRCGAPSFKAGAVPGGPGRGLRPLLRGPRGRNCTARSNGHASAGRPGPRDHPRGAGERVRSPGSRPLVCLPLCCHGSPPRTHRTDRDLRAVAAAVPPRAFSAAAALVVDISATTSLHLYLGPVFARLFILTHLHTSLHSTPARSGRCWSWSSCEYAAGRSAWPWSAITGRVKSTPPLSSCCSASTSLTSGTDSHRRPGPGRLSPPVLDAPSLPDRSFFILPHPIELTLRRARARRHRPLRATPRRSRRRGQGRAGRVLLAVPAALPATGPLILARHGTIRRHADGGPARTLMRQHPLLLIPRRSRPQASTDPLRPRTTLFEALRVLAAQCRRKTAASSHRSHLPRFSTLRMAPGLIAVLDHGQLTDAAPTASS